MVLDLAWAVMAVVILFLGGEMLIRLLIGTSDPMIIRNSMMSLWLSTACLFPLGVLFVMRTSMQAMGYKIVPLLSSGIELLFKVIATFCLIPVIGYLGVALAEPVTWIICAVYLVIVYQVTWTKKMPM